MIARVFPRPAALPEAVRWCGWCATAYQKSFTHTCEATARNSGAPVATKVKRPKRGAMAEIAMRKILNDLGFVAIECAPANLTMEYVYVAEFTFAPHERNWRCDFALPVARLAIEVDGGAHAAGKSKQRTDTEKRGELAARGYRVVAVTPEEVSNGTARERVARALGNAAQVDGGGE